MKLMQNKKRLITVAGTVVSAIGIGYFMQNTLADAPAPAVQNEAVARADFQPLGDQTFPGEEQEISGMVSDAVVDALPSALPMAEPAMPEGVEMAALDDGTSLAPVESAAPVEQAVPELSCEITATGQPDAGAMVSFSLEAPCLPNERVVIHHNGMMFTVATDEGGAADLLIPALSENAVIIAEFANGEGAVAMTEVPSLMFYDRVVLQWSGETGFQLHAREFGADYGDTGHVWAGAARDVTAAALGEGGFVTRLGDDQTLAPRVAEIYTFPSGTASQFGDIALSVEAEVTAANCGKDIEAQSMELIGDGELRTQYLTLAVSECDAIGDFLVLNNLVNDLKIAAN